MLGVTLSGAENFKVRSRFFGKSVNPWRMTGRLINSDESLRKSKTKCIRNLKNNHTVREQVQNRRSKHIFAVPITGEHFSHSTAFLNLKIRMTKSSRFRTKFNSMFRYHNKNSRRSSQRVA